MDFKAVPRGRQIFGWVKLFVCFCRSHAFSVLWVSGLAIGVALAYRVSLPFSNPLGVVGKLTLLRYNPASNFLRFFIVILMPVCLLVLGRWLMHWRIGLPVSGQKIFSGQRAVCRPSFRRKVSLLLGGAVLVLVVSLHLPTYHSWGEFDTFHEGESLGTSVSVEAGKQPYRDILFLHGLVQDPYRAILAYKLFGRSIGAVRSIESILKILSCLALFFLLCNVLDWNWMAVTGAFVLLALMVRLRLLLLMPRDLPTFIFMASVLPVFRHVKRDMGWQLYLRIFLASATASLAFTYSIDRGFYLTAALIVLLPLIILGQKKWAIRSGLLLSFLFGTALGGAVLYVAIGGHFQEFYRFVGVMIPKYKEFMDGAVFEPGRRMNLICMMAVSWPIYALVCAFLASNSADRPLWSRLLDFFYLHAEYIALILLSVFFLRSALGRVDREHLIYSAAPLYILYFRLLSSYVTGQGNLLQKFGEKRWLLCLLGLMVVCVGSAYHDHLGDKNFPLKESDDYFIPQNYQNTIRYLRTHLRPDEGFMTLTSEASWYYFLNKPSPSRFPVIYVAAPRAYQDEALRDILHSNVRFVLYSNDNWSNAIDEIPTRQRMPSLVSGIKANFRPCLEIDGNALWIRRDLYDARDCVL